MVFNICVCVLSRSVVSNSVIYIEKYANKGPSSQGYGFSSGHVWMWELDYKESWVLKNWCFWTVVLEKTLESPLDCKEIQPVHPKGNQSWMFIGRTDVTDVEAETPILWAADEKNWLTGKDPDVGKDWRQEEKGTTEDKMVGWHHWLDGHEFEQAPGIGMGREACCAAVHEVAKSQTWLSDWTELNWILKDTSGNFLGSIVYFMVIKCTLGVQVRRN